MGKVVYWMTASLDGFVEARDGTIDWGMPDAALFRENTEDARRLGAFLHGRRTYENMAGVWSTVGLESSAPVSVGGLAPELLAEFAAVWRSKPKIVFSRTLASVGPGSRLAREDLAVEVERAKREVEGDLGLSGATLAASFMQRGLIDEYRLFIRPILLGGGKPYFAALDHRVPLRLVEARPYPDGLVLLRYEPALAV
jgi:dihydrofolate reductase